VRFLFVLPHLEIALLGVAEAIALFGKGINVDELENPILRAAAARFSNVEDEIRRSSAADRSISSAPAAALRRDRENGIVVEDKDVDGLSRGIGRGRNGKTASGHDEK
jgi:hypothetical protein